MNDIQKQYLEILKSIDEICQKENLSYMLNAGTLLGAIREKGFIKWDDDADIMMHRKEYNAFEKCCHKYLENYGLFLYYPLRIPKIALIQNPAINVEIILIDFLPQNKLKRKLKFMKLKVLYTMLSGVWPSNNANQKVKHTLLRYGILLVGKFIKQETKQNLYKKISQTGSAGDSETIFFSNERVKYMFREFDKFFLRETMRWPFEDTELLIPKDWDAFLKLFYGDDYMIPKRENYYV